MEIKAVYHNIIQSARYDKKGLEVIMNITPSENSLTYTVRIIYRTRGFPQAILASPKLMQYDGKYPHHIYERYKNGETRLCVYHPGIDKWDSNVSIATSFIPWVSTWLNTYEYWLITGEWHYKEIFVGDGAEKAK